MKVFVTGATGVLGQSAIAALCADGHEVTGLARNAEKAAMVEAAGATVSTAQLFDLEAMSRGARRLRGRLQPRHQHPGRPVRAAPRRLEGQRPASGRGLARSSSQAAKAACVRRFVQESVSLLYADGGDEVLTEQSPLAVTRAVEPSAVAESNATDFEGPSRVAVILRFGQFIGDDADHPMAARPGQGRSGDRHRRSAGLGARTASRGRGDRCRRGSAGARPASTTSAPTRSAATR